MVISSFHLLRTVSTLAATSINAYPAFAFSKLCGERISQPFREMRHAKQCSHWENFQGKGGASIREDVRDSLTGANDHVIRILKGYGVFRRKAVVAIANAHQVKAIPGRKTDELDSRWLARIFSAGLVKPSYIPEKKIMELRNLTRLRVTLLQAQTAFKNRAHKTLQICNIRLASKLLDIIWHLLITGEEYIDKHYVKKTITKSKKKTLKLVLEEAIPLLKQAGYTIIAPG